MKIALLYFIIFPISFLYIFPCVWTNCRITFATLVEISSKHTFWTHQSLLQVAKNVDFSFYFLHTGIKRTHSMPSQDYTANDSLNRCFDCSKMLVFELMCESSHCCGQERSVFGGWFSCFLGTQQCYIQNWLFCVLIVLRLRHVHFFRNIREAIGELQLQIIYNVLKSWSIIV